MDTIRSLSILLLLSLLFYATYSLEECEWTIKDKRVVKVDVYPVSEVMDIEQGRDGFIYVLDLFDAPGSPFYMRVEQMYPNGTRTGKTYTLSQMGIAGSMHQDEDGYFWVLGHSWGDIYVFKYDENWTYTGISYNLGSFGKYVAGTYPDGELSDLFKSDGFWYVSKSTTNTIYKFYENWTYTGQSFNLSELTSDGKKLLSMYYDDQYDVWFFGTHYRYVYKYTGNFTYDTKYNVYTVLLDGASLHEIRGIVKVNQTQNWYIISSGDVIEFYAKSIYKPFYDEYYPIDNQVVGSGFDYDVTLSLKAYDTSASNIGVSFYVSGTQPTVGVVYNNETTTTVENNTYAAYQLFSIPWGNYKWYAVISNGLYNTTTKSCGEFSFIIEQTEFKRTGNFHSFGTGTLEIRDLEFYNNSWFVIFKDYYGNHVVIRYDENWTYAGFSKVVNQVEPWGFFYDSINDRWYVVGASNRVYEYFSNFTYTGNSYIINAHFNRVNDIFRGDDGYFYIIPMGSPPHVDKYYDNFTFIKTVYSEPETYGALVSLYQDRFGYWWVMDSFFDNVKKISNNWSKVLRQYQVVDFNRGLAINKNTNYWYVADYFINGVQEYTPSQLEPSDVPEEEPTQPPSGGGGGGGLPTQNIIYVNPEEGEKSFSIKLMLVPFSQELSIYDESGNLLFSSTVYNNQIIVLKEGVYYLTFWKKRYWSNSVIVPLFEDTTVESVLDRAELVLTFSLVPDVQLLQIIDPSNKIVFQGFVTNSTEVGIESGTYTLFFSREGYSSYELTDSFFEDTKITSILERRAITIPKNTLLLLAILILAVGTLFMKR